MKATACQNILLSAFSADRRNFNAFNARQKFLVENVLVKSRCHDLTKRTERNGPTKIPKQTSMGTKTDFSGYRNRLQLRPKRTSMGTRKGRVGYDRNDPNKIMYVLVGRYVGRHVCM